VEKYHEFVDISKFPLADKLIGTGNSIPIFFMESSKRNLLKFYISFFPIVKIIKYGSLTDKYYLNKLIVP